MNKADALFLQPSDFGNNNLSLAAAGLYVCLVALVQEHETSGRLELDGDILTIPALACELNQPEPHISASFNELIAVGLIVRGKDGVYILPVISRRIAVSCARATAGSLGGKSAFRRGKA